jgi:hypothetical protein
MRFVHTVDQKTPALQIDVNHVLTSDVAIQVGYASKWMICDLTLLLFLPNGCMMHNLVIINVLELHSKEGGFGLFKESLHLCVVVQIAFTTKRTS